MRNGMIAVLLLTLLALPATAATFTRNGPSTTNNDDSCDIGLYPAATLLLPYFEVSPVIGEQTTIFTVTNTGRLPAAIAVTLWTDYGYPVLTLPAYLTGYDVQSFDLYDIIFRGRIAPDRGTGFGRSPVGALSRTAAGQQFDNPQLVESSCSNLVVQLPQPYIIRMTRAFMEGVVPSLGDIEGCTPVGDRHTNAVGYVTVDVATICGASLPTDDNYFTAELGYDNVLMGDYIQLDQANALAQGNPMVHIRAIPEGGDPRTHRPTNVSRTFYSRLHPNSRRTIDGRQPLPSAFAARWIRGADAGTMTTFFKIWREVNTPASAACDEYSNNAFTPIAEVVRFDEDENPETALAVPVITPPVEGPALQATSMISFDRGDILPPNSTNAVGGWFYMNLDSGEAGEHASQNWVVVSMRAAGTYSVDFDALALGNGCTPPANVTNANDPRGLPIGPGPNRID